MARTYSYAVLRAVPDAARGEVVNIGIAVYRETGIDIRLLPNLHKVAALDGNANLEDLRRLPEYAARFTDNVTPELQHAAMRRLGAVQATENIGTLACDDNPESYEHTLSAIMDALVVPPAKKRIARESQTRLFMDIKRFFRDQKILGVATEEIHQHKVITHFPIAVNENLYAEFALKNGAFHITETVDFRVKDMRLKANEAAAKAITLDQAGELLGEDTSTFVIVAADDYSRAQSSINLLGKYAQHVLSHDSESDMRFYAERMLTAAGNLQIN